MLKATPAGLAEQAAGGGGSPKRHQCQKGKAPKGNKTKKAKPQKAAAKKAKAENCQNRQAGRREVEKKGGGGGKEEEEPRDRRRHSRYEWLSAGHEASEQFCSQLELGLSRARELPQAPLKLSSCEKA